MGRLPARHTQVNLYVTLKMTVLIASKAHLAVGIFHTFVIHECLRLHQAAEEEYNCEELQHLKVPGRLMKKKPRTMNRDHQRIPTIEKSREEKRTQEEMEMFD
jgi:hypothetical protein